MAYESIMVKPYTVKPGDTPSGVANMFGVSVDELQNYNKAVLGLDNKFNVGVQLRNPNEKMIAAKRAYDKGASVEDISKALKLDQSDVSAFVTMPKMSETIPPASLRIAESLGFFDGMKEDARQRNAIAKLPAEPMASAITNKIVDRYMVSEDDFIIPEDALKEIKVTAKRQNPNVEYVLSEAEVTASRRKPENISAPTESVIDVIREFIPDAPGVDAREKAEKLGRETALAGVAAVKSFIPEPNITQEDARQFGTSVGQSVKETFIPSQTPSSPRPIPSIDTTVEDDLNYYGFVVPDEALEERQAQYDERLNTAKALFTEAGEGLTFGLLGELKSAVQAATTDMDYDEAKARYDLARQDFARKRPDLAQVSAIAEFAGSLPTGYGLSRALTKAGVTSFAKQGAIEGSAYGVFSGDTLEERAMGGVIGGLGGLVLGKVVDVAISPSTIGGLRTKADDLADDAIEIEPVVRNRDNDAVLAKEIYDEVDDPLYAKQPLSEAKTFGEFYEGVKNATKNFYYNKISGIDTDLARNVSKKVGALIARIDIAALRIIDKDLDALSKELVPVLRIINDSTHAKGVLLDYGKGSLGKTREESLARLQKELSQELNSEHMGSLLRYLDYSFKKNFDLNSRVFGFSSDLDKTYLHTRLSSELRKKMKEEKGLTDEQLDELFEDPAFKLRSRGDYLNSGDPSRPNPLDYDNPIVSDMQRIFKMERLNQIQRVFGVDIKPMAEAGTLSPSAFMDAFAVTLVNKGISPQGAAYARRRVNELILGQDKTPHPVIQALSSLAYATTLAGPMSAVLNLADVPMVGAKYGARAVAEGAKAVVPGRFKDVPNVDLKKMGIGNQTFGEFMNIINDQAQNSNGFLMSMAARMRQGTDMLMKGSGFAAFDRIGKAGVMRGILRSAADDAQVGKLADNWGFYFNDRELGILTSSLKKHGTDWRKYKGEGKQLVEELMFAGLGQQQLISAVGRSSAWARNPNLRPLWALRGFVVRQQALALDEVVGNLKAGRPDKAAAFLGRYAAYGAGGYAIINEGRQFIFGDGEVSAGGMIRGYGDAWASLLSLNTLGLNDYQYGQIKENGILFTLAEGLVPIAISRPLEIIGKAADVIDQERPPQAVLTEAFPIIKQPARLGRNLSPEGSKPRSLFEGVLSTQND